MKISNIIKEIASAHPYKEKGNPNSYTDYNQGWSDACDILGERIKDEIEGHSYCPNCGSPEVVEFLNRNKRQCQICAEIWKI